MESDNIIQTKYNKRLVLIKLIEQHILKLNSITKYQTARNPKKKESET